MSFGLEQPVETGGLPRPRSNARLIVGCYSFLLLGTALSSALDYWNEPHLSGLHVTLPLIAMLGALFVIACELFPVSFPRRIVRLLFVGHREFPMADSSIEKRVCSRFYVEMKDLDAIGFSPLFFLGESKSVFSFFFLLPALTHWMMRSHREVLTRVGWFTLVTATVVLANKEKTAYGEPTGLGMLFRTKLQDGTIITTCNYGDSSAEGKWLRFAHKGASIAGIWEEHLRVVRSYEASGNSVSTEFGPQPYIQLFE